MTRLQSPSRLITPVALLIGLGCYVFTASADATEEDISRVNRSISIAAGLTVGDVSTVNGGIRLSEAAIAGEVHTVNGSIELGARARVDSAETLKPLTEKSFSRILGSEEILKRQTVTLPCCRAPRSREISSLPISEAGGTNSFPITVVP